MGSWRSEAVILWEMQVVACSSYELSGNPAGMDNYVRLGKTNSRDAPIQETKSGTFVIPQKVNRSNASFSVPAATKDAPSYDYLVA